MPSRPRPAMDSRMALRLCGSTPTVGSSRSSRRGRWSSPMPMLSRRCMPPLKVAVAVLRPVGEAHDVEDVVDASPELRAAEPVQAAEELEVLARGQVRVDRQLLGHVADARLGRHGPDIDQAAVDRHAPPSRGQEPADHRDRRRLARAVRPAGRTSRPRGSRTRRRGRPRGRRTACAGRPPRGRRGAPRRARWARSSGSVAIR